jgi:hypothetical protein
VSWIGLRGRCLCRLFLPVRCADDVAQLALANSPEVREAEQNVRKAESGLMVARMAYLPDISIVGGCANQTSASYIQPDIGCLGITGSWTLWEWGKKRDLTRQRHVDIDLAHQNVQVTMDKVALEARKTYGSFEEAREGYRLAGEMVQARKEAEKGASGPALLRAKGDTAKAELEYLKAEINYRVAHAQLAGVICQEVRPAHPGIEGDAATPGCGASAASGVTFPQSPIRLHWQLPRVAGDGLVPSAGAQGNTPAAGLEPQPNELQPLLAEPSQRGCGARRDRRHITSAKGVALNPPGSTPCNASWSQQPSTTRRATAGDSGSENVPSAAQGDTPTGSWCAKPLTPDFWLLTRLCTRTIVGPGLGLVGAGLQSGSEAENATRHFQQALTADDEIADEALAERMRE